MSNILHLFILISLRPSAPPDLSLDLQYYLLKRSLATGATSLGLSVITIFVVYYFSILIFFRLQNIKIFSASLLSGVYIRIILQMQHENQLQEQTLPVRFG